MNNLLVKYVVRKNNKQTNKKFVNCKLDQQNYLKNQFKMVNHHHFRRLNISKCSNT